MSRRTIIGRNLLPVYLAGEKQADVDGFDLLGFWYRKGTASNYPTTGKKLAPADMPYLTVVIAGLFHSIDATGCQAARNFSSLAHLIGDLRNNVLPANVEQMRMLFG